MNILLVEDDTGIADVLRRGLEAFGHPVDWVSTPGRRSNGWISITTISSFST